MTKRIITMIYLIIVLNSCGDQAKTENNLIGYWKLSQAFNSDGLLCSGLDLTKGCIYNKDQIWEFKNDSLFMTRFTSVVNVNIGDIITLTGKYKMYKEREDSFLEVKFDKFIDSSGIQKFKIIHITDSTLEYAKEKFSDGSGGMRLIFKKA
jgi:hypothetical protein